MVGNGNVAIDVARMLALTRDELAQTDVADHALDVLADSDPGDRRARPPRPRAGRVHQPGAAGAGRADRTPTCSSTRGDVELDPLSRRPCSRARPPAPPRARTSRSCRATPAREPPGKRRRIVLRFLVSPVEILGSERVEGIRIVPQRAAPRARTARSRPRATDSDRGARLRARVPLDRLPGHAARRRAVRRAQRHDPATSAGASSTRRPAGRRVRRRLDQARPHRHHRHEQARRPGDGRRAARGPRRGPAARARRPRPRLDRGAAGRAPARRRDLRRLGGDRPRRARGRRAARPPAREAVLVRGAARGRARDATPAP